MKKFITLITVLAVVLAASGQVNVAPKSNEEKLNEEYCSGVFRTSPGTILDVAGSQSAMGYVNIMDWIEGRVAGLKIQTTRYGQKIPLVRGDEVAIFVDEIPVSAAYLSTVPVSDIAIVKVIRTPFPGSMNNTPAIAVYRMKVSEEAEEEK
ncbi:MAG TPA: hypothetical protein VEB63_10495 [Chitinophagaceae bacterium]|nr:hypothetical protein [Chitinophagaceae bacterium]